MNLSYFIKNNIKPKFILDIGCNVGQFYNQCKNVWGSDVNVILIDGNENVEDDLIKLGVQYHITVLSDTIKKVIWYSTIENPKCTGDSYYLENTKHYTPDKLISIGSSTVNMFFSTTFK